MTESPSPSAAEAPAACHVMAKPTGSVCNIDCKYCFYLEKEKLYPEKGKNWRMSDEILELYVRQYIEAQDVPAVNFAWQGGEPTLMGVDYYRRAVELQAEYADGKEITNAFQTNGILLDDEWGEFLAANDFLVGLSVDGPRQPRSPPRRRPSPPPPQRLFFSWRSSASFSPVVPPWTPWPVSRLKRAATPPP